MDFKIIKEAMAGKSGVVFFVSFVLIAIGLFFGVPEINLRLNGTTTIAKCIRVAQSYDSDRNLKLYPVFKYYVDKRSYETKIGYSVSNGNSYSGRDVLIIYNNKNPHKIIIKNNYTQLFYSVFFLFIGGSVFSRAMRYHKRSAA